MYILIILLSCVVRQYLLLPDMKMFWFPNKKRAEGIC